MLDNLPWHALNTDHVRFAIAAPRARKYPSDVAPFAGMADDCANSMLDLASLLGPGETVYVAGDVAPQSPGLSVSESYPALQMIAAGPPPSLSRPDASVGRLSWKDADAMVQLTGLAFPGFFRQRTCEMGVYYGIRIEGQLVAMAGERMAVPQYREISGVCTHPGHTGKGYAAQLIATLMRDHMQAGLRSFLHVSPDNDRALALYTRLGFVVRTEIRLHPVCRDFPS